jgi:hypothetical protein
MEQDTSFNLSSHFACLILYLLTAQTDTFYYFFIENDCPIVGAGTKATFRSKREGYFATNNQVKVSFKSIGYLHCHRHPSIRDGERHNSLVFIFTKLGS